MAEIVVQPGLGKALARAGQAETVLGVEGDQAMAQCVVRQILPGAVARREGGVFHYAAHDQHALRQAEWALLRELVLHDVGDLAAAQEVELEDQHLALGEAAQIGEFGRGDAQRLGESFHRGNGLARRHAVGQRHDEHAVGELLPEFGRREAGGEFRRRDRRQGVDAGVDAEDDPPGRLHQGPLRRPDRAGGRSDRLQRAQAEQGGSRIGF